jgi:hypothetical protein
MKYVMNIALALASVALAYGSTAGSAAAADVAATDVAGAQAATWTPKELSFTYQGFTTRYSCSGLREKVRSTLLALGARRKDLAVNESGCSSLNGGPDPFPGVRIKMQVLTPVAAAAKPDANTVAAHWKTVDLRLDRDALSESGDCELLEQIKQSILPLFTTRNIKYSSTCVPHQLSVGGTKLRADVLVSDAPDAAPAVPAAPAAH